MKFADMNTISKITDKFVDLERQIDELTQRIDNEIKTLKGHANYIDNRLYEVEDTMHDYTIKSIDSIMMYDQDGKLITLTGISNPTLEITSDSYYSNNNMDLLTPGDRAITFTATCKNLKVVLPEAMGTSGSQIKTRRRDFSTKKVQYKNSFDFM